MESNLSSVIYIYPLVETQTRKFNVWNGSRDSNIVSFVLSASNINVLSNSLLSSPSGPMPYMGSVSLRLNMVDGGFGHLSLSLNFV